MVCREHVARRTSCPAIVGALVVTRGPLGYERERIDPGSVRDARYAPAPTPHLFGGGVIHVSFVEYRVGQ